MNLIQNITASPYQKQTLQLPNGNSALLTLYFSQNTNTWFFTNITYQSFILNGFAIVNNPNLLNQFINQLPFGIGCFSSGSRDPQFVFDFSSGYSSLYLLSAAECAAYQAYLSGGSLAD